jgi:1,4-alpha-glucan branching enzyme
MGNKQFRKDSIEEVEQIILVEDKDAFKTARNLFLKEGQNFLIDRSMHKCSTKSQLDNVHFWGSVTEKLKLRLLRSCDICVFPSRDEPFGIVLLEAMAAGKPIISIDVGGIPEILTHLRNGILVNPEPRQLAQAMKLMLERKEL